MTIPDTPRSAQPIAEIRVTLHSLEDGEAEVALAVDPDGELNGVYGDPEQRFAALQTLFEVVQRELGDALDTLANGEDEPDDDERASLPRT
ncbi:MAG TPA: hypothetical protein VGT61_04425 [Thermomicrobiales bacterium]|jgi:hypothetical protein|nr:hypothetical protein [Thermomicrobiales bacterium]